MPPVATCRATSAPTSPALSATRLARQRRREPGVLLKNVRLVTIPVYGGADGISTETVPFGVLGRVILALGRWRSTAGLGRDPRGDLGHSWGARFPVAAADRPAGRRSNSGCQVRDHGRCGAFSAFAGTA